MTERPGSVAPLTVIRSATKSLCAAADRVHGQMNLAVLASASTTTTAIKRRLQCARLPRH